MCGVSASLEKGNSGSWKGMARALLQMPGASPADIPRPLQCEMLARARISTLEATTNAEIAAKGANMGKIIENLYLTLAIGLVLAILIMLLPDSSYAPPYGTANGILQWL